MTDVKQVMDPLRAAFGSRLQEDVVLANYTTARIGGKADALLPVNTLDELVHAAQTLWSLDVPFTILGSGSNVLVADQGVRAVVLHNRAHTVKIDTHHSPPTVFAESGANLGAVARQCALRGLSGLEWAATIPGTVGGAVYGNAGAHGADMASNLIVAEILHRTQGRQTWPVERLQYAYRTSIIKCERLPLVILSAWLQLQPGATAEVQARMDEFAARRRSTQPPGASLGSMFKNPPDDKAGRLIDACGLKGRRIGGAEISPVHANFFINQGSSSAADMTGLIDLTRRTVANKFGIELELEIELLGFSQSPVREEQPSKGDFKS